MIHGITGQDIPLSIKGREEAKNAGAKLKDEVFTGVYCSNTVRTHETASLILNENAHDNDASHIQRWEVLRERDWGVMEGHPTSVLHKEVARLGLKTRREILLKYNPEGGETLDDLRQRARKVIEALLEKAFSEKTSSSSSSKSPNLLVATHGLTLFEIVRCLAEEMLCTMPCDEKVYGEQGHTNTGIT
ncbi:unnamed protein product [Sphagnum tenellum]